ncbi:MAG TPA: transglutaminase family protein [Chthonomonadaceae bacterium]|nr:transglutaminase family protein [Chthonomonadaceae bacterium]
MLIRVGYDIEFDLPAPTPMLTVLKVHPSRAADLRRPDTLYTEPDLSVFEYTDGFGNRCGRLHAPAGALRLHSDALVEDSGELDAYQPDALQHPVEELPADVIQFLLGSRYCEVDKLSQIAWDLFSHTELGWPRVQAICDWVHRHVHFDYMLTHPGKTALDVYNEATGVCRDFQHLAIAFCRSLNIPARYATGYLPDIGIECHEVMDYAAWFEVYLGGRWYTFDARNNTRRIGRVLMATGRDAVDVALTTSFGNAILKNFVVIAEQVAS